MNDACEDKLREAHLEAIVILLARAVGNFQAGHEAPWVVVASGESLQIECANGLYVMEVSPGDWDAPPDEKEGYEARQLQSICDIINAADEASAALTTAQGTIPLTIPTLARAAAIAREHEEILR